MKKRLISMLLSAALFVTSIPMPVSADNQVNEGNASTAVSSEGNQGETQENGIDYKMNGGAFTSGYEAPRHLSGRRTADRGKYYKGGIRVWRMV